MNTVRRHSDPHNPWWRYQVDVGGVELYSCANAQAAADWIQAEHPGEAFHWDTRDPKALDEAEQLEIDRHEDARHDAFMESVLEAEEENP